MIRTTSAWLGLLMVGTVATATAQMKDMKGMMDMKPDAHHALAMAYKDNFVSFAKALDGQILQARPVDLAVARQAVAEMRHSFDQMREHHQAHMDMMDQHMKSSMSEMMEGMAAHEKTLGEHLTALEAELNAATPNPASLSEHSAELVKHSAGMSGMSPKAKPPAMR